MKEKLEPLEEISSDIFELTQKCAATIFPNTEDSRVVNQALRKLSTRINEIHLRIINEE